MFFFLVQVVIGMPIYFPGHNYYPAYALERNQKTGLHASSPTLRP